MDEKNEKMNPRIIFVIALSTLVLLVVCFGIAAILLNCRKARRPSSAVGPAITPSINKRCGMLLNFCHACLFVLFLEHLIILSSQRTYLFQLI